ncbi:MAG TPA: LCP family protein [Gaiellaceae bacterium]|nr:LCP family protein [Gaiellaceae bacterium]
MAGKDKPYKLYRGGRVRGPVRPLRETTDGRGRDGYARGPEAPKRTKTRRRRWRRTVVLVLVGLVVLALVWALLGYLAIRRGVQEANDRLPDRARTALASPDGSILSTATNTLVIGADNGGLIKERQGVGRADTLMLIRTDPDENRIAYLHIPRDLRVDIPGRGADRINAAYSLGEAALTVDTVEAFTGLQVHHVVVVNFGSFREVVDALGGITIDNPEPVLSRFECPFRGAERCARFQGWRFPKGELQLDGRRALIYARIRKNELSPNESDITRGERGQRVIQAIQDEVVSFSGFLRMPLIGDDVVTPLATDLSTGELLQLAWVRRRAADEKTLRCRLGGTPVNVNGAAVLQSSEDNAEVLLMVTGRSQPQRPPAGQPFEPGCFVGRAP